MFVIVAYSLTSQDCYKFDILWPRLSSYFLGVHLRLEHSDVRCRGSLAAFTPLAACETASLVGDVSADLQVSGHINTDLPEWSAADPDTDMATVDSMVILSLNAHHA